MFCCGRTKREILQGRANRKLSRQLDIVRVLRAGRKAEMLFEIMLNQSQRYFASAYKSSVVKIPKSTKYGENSSHYTDSDIDAFGNEFAKYQSDIMTRVNAHQIQG
jgi:hypothetical protein